jgi:hypothetical protein
VRKAVENRGYTRITSHNLWIRMWIEKYREKRPAQVLRSAGLAQ